MLRTVCLVSLFLLFSSRLNATSPFDLQIPGLVLKLRVDRLSPGPGRNINMVYDIEQDSLGFIWFGAEDGLFRYDGYEYLLIGEADGLRVDRAVRAIFLDNEGTLWYGTTGGVFGRCDPGTLEVQRHVNSPADSARWMGGWINAVFRDSRGFVWIGTQDSGLWRFDPSSGLYSQFLHDPADAGSIRSNRVQAIAEFVPEKIVLIGTDEGLSMIDAASGEPAKGKIPVLGRTDIQSISVDRFNDAWVGTAGTGVYQLGGFEAAALTSRKVAEGQYVRSMFRQDERHLWLASQGGLQVVDTRTGQTVTWAHDPLDPNSVSDDLVRSVFVDRTGTMWLGTQVWLNRVVRRAWLFDFAQYTVPGLEDPSMTAVYSDREGGLWLGGNFPLLRISADGAVRRYRLQPQNRVSNEYNTVVLQDRTNRDEVWIGTWGDGVKKLNLGTGSVSHFRTAPDGPDNHLVYSMMQDSRGILWIGEMKGLVRFDPRDQTYRRYLHQADDPWSLSSDRVRTIMEDENGRIWAGTEVGLNRYEPESDSFSRFVSTPADSLSLPSNFVMTLFRDTAGRFWIGTDGGLCLMDGQLGTFRRIEGGIPSSRVQTIVTDASGRLWFGTWGGGIVSFDPRTGKTEVYDMRDGLLTGQISLGAAVLPGGRLAFATNAGLTIVDPEGISRLADPPSAVITEFRVRDRGHAVDASHEFPHDQNFLMFGFAALDFADPASNRFQYRLGGADDIWQDIGGDHSVRFPSIQPGSYEFSVRGAGGDGEWGSPSSPVLFTILPPFWDTWWFRISGVLVIAIASFGAYRYRVNRILEVERLRLKIASDLHDDVGSSLSNIALISDFLRKEETGKEQRAQDLEEIAERARTTAGALREIVWLINPENEGGENLVLRMKDISTSMLRNLSVSFTTRGQIFVKPPDLQFRRNLLLIYKEMLHNIVKHAQATEVTITLEETDGTFRLRVTDNGVGFDESKVTKGNGLKIMRRRAEEMGGRLEVGGGQANFQYKNSIYRKK